MSFILPSKTESSNIDFCVLLALFVGVPIYRFSLLIDSKLKRSIFEILFFEFVKMARLKRLSKKNIERLEKGLDAIPSEDIECEWFVVWLERDLWFDVFTHVSNETWTPSILQRNKNSTIGVRSGVPDYIIVLPRWFTWKLHNTLVFIEMKITVWGVVSANQKKWIAALSDCPGVDVSVCKWYKEAREYILKFASERVKEQI